MYVRDIPTKCDLQKYCCPPECKGLLLVDTPFGADHLTCPLCDACDSLPEIDEQCDKFTDAIYSHPDIDYSDRHFGYCKNCKILFAPSCTHRVAGCTDSTQYALLVKSFTLDGVKYDDLMPTFSSFDEVIDTIKDYKFEFVCTCKGFSNDCLKSGWTDKYPKVENNCKYTTVRKRQIKPVLRIV